MTRYRNKIW